MKNAFCSCVVWCAVFVGHAFGAEAERTAAEPVELFAAMARGEVQATLIVKSDRAANVLLKNNTARPLAIVLPTAFAGVPVLAQFQPANAQPGANANSNNQTVGSGFNPAAGPGRGANPGFFNLPAERQVKIEVPCVCLEHGKENPHARLAYELKPLAEFTTTPGVAELCAALARREVKQRAAQAAAWHLSNGLSWSDLAAKELKHANGRTEPYFTPEVIEQGQQAAALALKR